VKPNKSEIVAQIVRLPQTFHSLGNISIFSLLEATGYFKLHDQISEQDFHAALIRCAECVKEWMQYAEDKRTANGWYVTVNDEGCYETGYIADDGTRTNRLQYDNAIDACAAFIKREIESIRSAQ
jgi:hypothetical protein